MSKVISLRLSDDTAARLQAAARRAGRSVSELGACSIEESLRHLEFADIEFRGTGGERHVCLHGALPAGSRVRWPGSLMTACSGRRLKMA